MIFFPFKLLHLLAVLVRFTCWVLDQLPLTDMLSVTGLASIAALSLQVGGCASVQKYFTYTLTITCIEAAMLDVSKPEEQVWSCIEVIAFKAKHHGVVMFNAETHQLFLNCSCGVRSM